MTSVSHCFKTLRDRGECALIPFITAGDPDLETTAKALSVLAQSGADIIELGVPYSDPLADGPVIQAAATRALNRGVKLEGVLKLVEDFTKEYKTPIVLFIYYNPIYYRGVDSFLAQIAAAGVKGLVVPDLPLEEADNLLKPASEMGIEVTLLVAPTSPIERIKAIAQQSQGFTYLVSVTGVTGVRSQVASRVKELIASMRTVTDKPIGVGFGISTPEQALQVKQWGADAVIVGSAIVKRLAENPPEAGLKSIAEFCHSLKQAIING
ncbi:tryptophan synthase, alpha subunit [Gloeothece citriformis PCC 7424]|uniref:Tryptophan synthase alpha chain n=1 Tax=Gloeothece citriformis (strain PCC 7424) TaxID=65393 RepID=B7KCY4_GLOC7|nr:tryptophan synthase subunit alpha [Gloeothece citriformis]ACK73105.1 tryptophan synthase, alpha subunit [Gloeothece citriformis PCC 7424]